MTTPSESLAIVLLTITNKDAPSIAPFEQVKFASVSINATVVVNLVIAAAKKTTHSNTHTQDILLAKSNKFTLTLQCEMYSLQNYIC